MDARAARRAGARVMSTARRALRRAPDPPGGLPVPDYPWEANPRPRWGHGRPSHAGLAGLLAGHEGTFAATLGEIARYRDELAAIPARTGVPASPQWLNAWLPGLDAATIYGLLRARAPARYLEVGAGTSTLFAERARRDGGLDTTFVAIDPAPRADVAAVCDELVEAPLQDTDLAPFAALVPGDMVFFDGSHRAVMNSDVVIFLLELLPALPPGVIVGIHDVFLPDDYLPEWSTWGFSEQYLLAAYLLARAAFVRPLLGTWHASHRPRLAGVLDPLWEDPGLRGVERRGWGFWLETG